MVFFCVNLFKLEMIVSCGTALLARWPVFTATMSRVDSPNSYLFKTPLLLLIMNITFYHCNIAAIVAFVPIKFHGETKLIYASTIQCDIIIFPILNISTLNLKWLQIVM